MEKTMYEKLEWPDIQEFMEDDDYVDRVYFDPEKKVWLAKLLKKMNKIRIKNEL